jgi:hypothetical protein
MNYLGYLYFAFSEFYELCGIMKKVAGDVWEKIFICAAWESVCLRTPPL